MVLFCTLHPVNVWMPSSQFLLAVLPETVEPPITSLPSLPSLPLPEAVFLETVESLSV